jgi:hypothetical protein
MRYRVQARQDEEKPEREEAAREGKSEAQRKVRVWGVPTRVAALQSATVRRWSRVEVADGP